MSRGTGALMGVLRSGLSGASFRARVPESIAVFVTCALIAFPRTGAASWRGVVWAEDGSVVLQGAYQSHGWHQVMAAYEGYAIVLPRLIGLVVSYFPIPWHGLLVNLSAVGVQSGLALFCFHASRGYMRRGGALLVAVCAAAVPVGPEVAGNLANLQWFLLFAACLAPWWTPATPIGRIVGGLIVAAACLTGPFGAFALLLTALAWLLFRRRDLLLLLVLGAVSLAVQLCVMVTAPPRDIPMTPQWNPIRIADSYVRRVLGDGILGLGRYPENAASSPLLPGVLVAAVLVALLIVLAHARGVPAVVVPIGALLISCALYAGPVALSDVTGHIGPVWGGRYSVAPALMLYLAIAVMADRAFLDDAAGGVREASGGAAQKMLCAGIMSALMFGLLTSWSKPANMRAGRPSWPSEVSRAAAVCGQHVRLRAVAIQIAPPGWAVSVPCARLRGSG